MHKFEMFWGFFIPEGPSTRPKKKYEWNALI